MKDTLSYVVASIVDNPQEVVITEDQAEGLITLSIHVHKDDMGKVIGKEGKVIRSIRNIMKIIAMKRNEHINIMLAENQ